MHKLGSRATATRGSRIEEAAVLDHFREELIYLPGKLYERAKKDRRRFPDESFRTALRHV